MDPTEVAELLGLLEQRLIDEGVDAQVHGIGGLAMALLFPNDDETRVTRDIDAAVYPFPWFDVSWNRSLTSWRSLPRG